KTGKFTSIWFNSRSTNMSMRQSRDKFNGEEIMLYSAGLGEEGMGPPRSRTVTRLEDGGRKIVHRHYAKLPDGGERLMMELVLTPKAAPKATGRGAAEGSRPATSARRSGAGAGRRSPA